VAIRITVCIHLLFFSDSSLGDTESGDINGHKPAAHTDSPDGGTGKTCLGGGMHCPSAFSLDSCRERSYRGLNACTTSKIFVDVLTHKGAVSRHTILLSSYRLQVGQGSAFLLHNQKHQ